MAEGQAPDGPAARRKTASRRVSKTSTIAPPEGSIARCSKSSPTANGSTPTTIWLWSGRPASPRAGSPAPLATKPAATAAPSSIIAGRSSAGTWRSPAATAAIRVSSNPSAAPICSFSTTSASSRSTPAPGMTCSKSSRSDMDADRSTIATSQLPLAARHGIPGRNHPVTDGRLLRNRHEPSAGPREPLARD